MRFLSLITLACLAGSSFAQINVAASANGATATQSSIWTPSAVAENAIDGNRNGDWGANGILTLNHTGYEPGAWLRISFSGTHSIDTLNLWNRTDFVERLNPFSVRLYDGGSVVWQATGQTFSDNIVDGLTNTKGMLFTPGGVLADMVEVQLDGANYLHLAEVEAFSPVPEPATLLGLGAGALLFVRRRRSQRTR